MKSSRVRVLGKLGGDLGGILKVETQLGQRRILRVEVADGLLAVVGDHDAQLGDKVFGLFEIDGALLR